MWIHEIKHDGFRLLVRREGERCQQSKFHLYMVAFRNYSAVVLSVRGRAMKNFIHQENLKLFRKQLAETTDPTKRQMLLKLLAEEEAQEPLSADRDAPSSPGHFTEGS